MPLNETIIKRKSIRKYLETPLSALEISEICECIHNIKPLFDGIAYSMKVIDEDAFSKGYGGLFVVKAPNYIVIHSKKEDGYLLNAGYVGEMLILGLTAKGYGTCWLGGAKLSDSENAADGLPYVIAIAVGRTEEPFRVSEVDANRKPIEDIVTGSPHGHMDALRAGRIAPSGMNAQPARYLVAGEKLHVFRSKAGSIMGLFDRMRTIDCGIAIATIIAAEPQYRYSVEDDKPLMKSCVYVGTLTAQSE